MFYTLLQFKIYRATILKKHKNIALQIANAGGKSIILGKHECLCFKQSRETPFTKREKMHKYKHVFIWSFTRQQT